MSSHERHNDWNPVSASWDYESSSYHQTKAILQEEGGIYLPGSDDDLSLEHPPFSSSDQTHFPAIYSPTYDNCPQTFQHFPGGNTDLEARQSRDYAPKADFDSTSFPNPSMPQTQQWAYNNLVWDTDLEPSPTTSTPTTFSISPSAQSNTPIPSPPGEALPSSSRRSSRAKPSRKGSESTLSRKSTQLCDEASNERKQNAQQMHSKVEQSYRNRLNDAIDALAKQLFDGLAQSRETIKPSKSLVITHARERLEQGEIRNKELQWELERVKEENVVLRYLLEKEREHLS